MKTERKRSQDNVQMRDMILDAAETIMAEDGYSAATSRRVAEQAGLKSQLVHYYFATMEDLFVAVYERAERTFLDRYLKAVSSPSPLRALWNLSLHPQRTRLSQELVALSNRHKSMRKITQRIIEQTRSISTVFISKYLQEAGIDEAECPPMLVYHLINGLSHSLVADSEFTGLVSGQAEVLDYVERLLANLEARHGTVMETVGAASRSQSAA